MKLFISRPIAFAFAVACLLLMGLITATLSSAWDSPLIRAITNGQVQQQTATHKSPDQRTTAESEGVPLYPRAEISSENCREGRPGSCVYFLQVKGLDSMDKIAAYYKEILPTKGWVFIEEGTENGYGMLFVWTDPDAGIPGRRYLGVAVGSSAEVGNTSIILDFDRWPDPNKIPLYKAVGDPNVRWQTNSRYGYQERVTTYTTSATPDEVTSYYQDMMIQNGWWNDKYETYPGLSFMYSRGTEGAWRHSRVGINMKAEQAGETVVELIASGNEIKP